MSPAAILKRCRIAGPAALLTVLLAGCCSPARADDSAAASAAKRDADVARLFEEVLRKAGGNGEDALSEWTRSIVDRALERAGEAARRTVPGSESGAGPGGSGDGVTSAAPLPAERHAGALSDPRPATPDILVFTSLSVPVASWRQWAREAAAVGAPLVLRGAAEGGLRATVKEVGARLGGAEAGVAIDPRLFRLFDVTRVPAVVVVPGGVPPCASRGCADDRAPLHDRITGNVGLAAALEAVALEGAVGRNAARVHLHRLRGEDRP